MRFYLLVFFIFFSVCNYSQTQSEFESNAFNNSNLTPEEFRDSIKNANEKRINVQLDGETHWKDYKIISQKYDTTFIDTTLSIKKYYKFNFTGKDNFELMAFHNQGQTFNKLAYDFNSTSFLPEMGMDAKYFNFKQVEDIVYYRVPTPTTVLTYRTGLEQGQVLNALLTMNTSPNFNFSVAYKGLRSLGKYRRSLASNKNLRATFNYRSKNDRYYARGHYVIHNFLNEESGGLTPESDIAFRTDDSNYKDRGRMDVNFDDAENTLESKRYHLEHQYKVLEENDSTKTFLSNLTAGHIYSYQTNHYLFSMTQNDLIGDAFQSDVSDDTGLKTMDNQLYLEVNSPIVLGKLRAKGNYYKYDHYFKGVTFQPGQIIDQNMQGSTFSAGADWDATIGEFNLKADVSSIISGDLDGNKLAAVATYAKDSLFAVKAGLSSVSKSPNFNFLHFQSDYIAYNWQREDYRNVQTQQLSFDFISDKWFNASASIANIDNYTYFDENALPQQTAESISYLKLKLNKAFTLGHFTLENTLMYQNISSGEDYFRAPEFVTRNSFFYTNSLFKNKPLFLQTGITFKYFTKYFMNDYSPLLSEFHIQNTEEFGGFPMFDFFANARVRRTRIYFKFENITAAFTGRDYYSAPLHPYRDFVIRFGLVWNFFI